MFNIFRKKHRFYYPELKPGERIEKVLLEFILPELEPLGFRFLKSELCFVRTYGEFENKIYILKSKWNNGNEICAFTPSLAVYSKELPKYLKVTAERKTIGFMAGSVEYIDEWKDNYFDGYYDLAKNDNVDLIAAFRHNLMTIGMDYFNKFNTYLDVVNHYLEYEKQYYMSPDLFDLCEMNRDRESAARVLNWFEDNLKTTSKEFHEDTLKAIEIRKEKLKNW